MTYSGKDIFLMFAVAGLVLNAGLNAVLGNDETPPQIQVINYQQMLKDAKLEFSKDETRPEMVQMNTALFISYLQSALKEIEVFDPNTIILDSSAVYSGPVVDLTEFVYERAMEEAKENIGSDGILKMGAYNGR